MHSRRSRDSSVTRPWPLNCAPSASCRSRSAPRMTSRQRSVTWQGGGGEVISSDDNDIINYNIIERRCTPSVARNQASGPAALEKRTSFMTCQWLDE
jgi:hypothetical protein